jgi:cis-L-3-hydroxyproline dehydratase
MKIAAIRTYKVDLPLKEGRYAWADGKFVEVFDSTVVEILTDDGRSGVGEICPLGPFYLPAYGPGARAGVAELAPHLIGLDPRDLTVVEQVMDRALLGHPYVKTALDMACWDLLGQDAGLPVVTLLGGRHGESVALYRAISQGAAEAMAENVAGYRAEGYTKFQLKVGGGRTTTSPASARWPGARTRRRARGRRQHRLDLGRRAARGERRARRGRLDRTALPDLRRMPGRPARHLAAVHPRREHRRARRLHDRAQRRRDERDQPQDLQGRRPDEGPPHPRPLRGAGLSDDLEDSWGGDIVTAAIAALSHSTPERFRFSATDFNSYVTVSFADGAPQRVDGRMRASDAPGLGVTLKRDVVGKPLGEYLNYNMAPNPMKVALFLEEAGLDYEPVAVDTRRGDQHNAAFRAINPNGKVPAIIDGEVTVFDSNAILLYLADKTGQFLPPGGDRARGELLSWLCSSRRAWAPSRDRRSTSATSRRARIPMRSSATTSRRGATGRWWRIGWRRATGCWATPTPSSTWPSGAGARG